MTFSFSNCQNSFIFILTLAETIILNRLLYQGINDQKIGYVITSKKSTDEGEKSLSFSDHVVCKLCNNWRKSIVKFYEWTFEETLSNESGLGKSLAYNTEIARHSHVAFILKMINIKAKKWKLVGSFVSKKLISIKI